MTPQSQQKWRDESSDHSPDRVQCFGLAGKECGTDPPSWWLPSMPHGGRDVFPFSPQRCCRHLQSLYRVQEANPTLNQGRNAKPGAAAAAIAGNGTDCLAPDRQACETLIERPWPSTSARTAEAAGFVPTDPWPGGWYVRTAALRPEAELRGPHHIAAGAATQNAG